VTDDVRKLLAGYATGTLTDDERRTLLEAALVDEELFAAIAEEETLRELLSDSGARAELLGRIEPAPRAFRDKFAAWLRRPAVAGGLATAAVAVVVVSIVPLMRMQPVVAPRVPQVGTVTLHAPMPAPEAAAPAAPAPKPRRARSESVAAGVVTPQAGQFAEPPQPSPAAPASGPETKAEMAAQPAAPAVEQTAAEQRADLVRARPLEQPAGANLVQPPPAPILAFRDTQPAARLAKAKLAEQAKSLPGLTVLRKAETGAYVSVNPLETVFAPGDMVRLRVQPAESGVVSIRGAIAQPIVGVLVPGRLFETGDIRIGSEDIRLIVGFGKGPEVVRTLATGLQAGDAAAADVKPEQAAEILLRVKKP
jgi:hypothetical protein